MLSKKILSFLSENNNHQFYQNKEKEDDCKNVLNYMSKKVNFKVQVNYSKITELLKIVMHFQLLTFILISYHMFHNIM